MKAQAIEKRARATEERDRAIKKKAKATEERIASTAIRAMEEYKDSDAFVNDDAKPRKEAYFFGFTNNKNIMAQAYPVLDLSGILASRE